jgi:hypothetical protein
VIPRARESHGRPDVLLATRYGGPEMAAAELERRALRLPWAPLAAAGGLALVVFGGILPALGGPYLEPGRGGTTYRLSAAVLALFVPYALALLAWRRGYRRPAVRTIFLGAAVLHTACAIAPPWGSQDLYQYLFYGKVAAQGANPYLVQPAAFAADPWSPFITWTTQTTVYGPAWTMATTGVVGLAGSSLAASFAGMKALVLGLDLAVMGLIVALGRQEGSRAGASPSPQSGGLGLMAWALNPLVLVAVPVEAHADIAIGAAFVGAALARRMGRSWAATLLLALAALVKAYAAIGLLFHLVLLLRERGTRIAGAHAAGAAALAVALYAPYFGGIDTFAGAGEVAGRFGTSLTGTLFRLITWSGPGIPADPGIAGTVILVAGAATVAVAVARLGWNLRDSRRLWPAVTLGLAAYFLATPWFFPWHLVPLIALAGAFPDERASPAVLTAGASTLVAFRFPAYELGLVLQAGARYLPPIVVYGSAARRARARVVRVRTELPVAPPATPR